MSESEDYQELAADLDHEADRLQHEGDRLGEHISDAREDWAHKRADAGVPGANPPEPEEDDEQEHASGAAGAPEVETEET